MPFEIVQPPVVRVSIDLVPSGELGRQRRSRIFSQVVEDAGFASAEVLGEPVIDAGDDQPAPGQRDCPAVDKIAGALLQ